MESRYRGPKGAVGNQGPTGPPGPPGAPYRPLGRYITAGGSRSLTEDCGTVILDTEERVTLHLPKLEISGEIPDLDLKRSSRERVSQETRVPDDALYYPIFITIYCIKGSHCVISSDKRINQLFANVHLDCAMTQYEFVSTPIGWNFMIFKSKT